MTLKRETLHELQLEGAFRKAFEVQSSSTFPYGKQPGGSSLSFVSMMNRKATANSLPCWMGHNAEEIWEVLGDWGTIFQ